MRKLRNAKKLYERGGTTAKVIASTENMAYSDWLELRKRGIGGSDASVVCGINRYKSPVQLWMEKTGQLHDEESAEPAYWGTQLENLVREEFALRTGLKVRQEKQLLQSEDCSFMQANLDGICESMEYGPCVFEAKTASAYKEGEWENTIPAEYMLQLQHYMAVTGYHGAYIAVLIGGNSFRWKFIERDEELIAILIQLERDFWRHVEEMTPPPLDGSDATARFLAQRFPSSAAQSKIQLPASAEEVVRNYRTACEEIDRLKEQKQLAENKLKEMMGEHEIGLLDGSIITWKSYSQERLDSKTLKIEHPALYKKYCTKTTSRRFSVQPTGQKEELET